MNILNFTHCCYNSQELSKKKGGKILLKCRDICFLTVDFISQSIVLIS